MIQAFADEYFAGRIEKNDSYALPIRERPELLNIFHHNKDRAQGWQDQGTKTLSGPLRAREA
jgi:hypothetical protein